MQEVICINIGQAGIQLSNATWELLCIEHGIEANGKSKESVDNDDSQALRTFFCEAPNGQYVPRTLSVDLEQTVIDEIRMGSYRSLFHPDQLINVFEDGCNNFARAHFTVGKQLIDRTIFLVRKMIEGCDNLQGFFLLHSHGGGTGSGFTSLILKGLDVEFSKCQRFQFSIFPSPILASSVVEPYNCILSSTSDIEQSDITSLVNNEALYAICHNLLHVSRPTYSNINRVIAHVFSDITVSLRFASSLSSDFSQMITNLIPYPRIHFPLICHSPMGSENKAGHETTSTQQITRCIFDPSSQLISCETKNGLFMSCVMQYRGKVTPKDVSAAIFDIKRRQDIKFVDWSPTGFKVGINSHISPTVPRSEMAQTVRSLTMISSSTAIKDPMERILMKFMILLRKRSFVHWFVGEGMEDAEFNEAQDEINSLIMDYMELSLTEDDITQTQAGEEKQPSSVDKDNMSQKDENQAQEKKEPSLVNKEGEEILDKMSFPATKKKESTEGTKNTSDEEESESKTES